MIELKRMLDIIVGDEPKSVKLRQMRGVEQTLKNGDVMLPCRKKRMDYWYKLTEELF
jgi:hypothetical protein